MARRSRYIDDRASRSPRMWLAVDRGVRLSAPRGAIAPIDLPEVPLEVEFVGLTLEQQRAAISGFPGGNRFVLVSNGTRRQ